MTFAGGPPLYGSRRGPNLRSLHMRPGIELRWFSERHVRVDMPRDVAGVSPHAIAGALAGAAIPGLIDVVPAAESVLLHFDVVAAQDSGLLSTLGSVIGSMPPSTARLSQERPFRVPFCAESEFAPDLSEVASRAGLTSQAFLERFCAGTYQVAFIGFMPGFAYIQGLDAALHAPRLDVPRPVVPAGSVGIGGEMTGIYPAASPGGWRLIGRTPLVLFDAARERPSLLASGDRVSFELMSRGDFDAATRSASSGEVRP